MKRKIFNLLVLACLLFCSVSLVSCDTPEDNTPVVKEEYTFTYKLNYEGAGEDKVITVKHGRRSNNWKASRTGYTLDGWFLDAACTKEYDFKEYVTSDIVVYANWVKNAEKYDVTLYYNYSGNEDSVVIKGTEGEVISENSIPTSPRLGYVYEGWYLDSECTEKWDFANDVVEGEMSLYAKYQRDSSIPLNADGTIKYENVVVNVFLGADFGTGAYLDQIVTKFNTTYDGKIKVVISKSISEQGNFSLRIQQTQGMNATYANYYAASAVYDLAGIELNGADYFKEASRTNYINGIMYSVPLAAGVPCLVYNKALMDKYSAGSLPTDYSEFLAVMTAAHAGELTAKPTFKSIVSQGDWTFKEAASYAALVQNDADPYVYVDGAYVNTWDAEAVNANTALNNFYDLFGANGAAKGAGNISNGYSDTTALGRVLNGEALFAVINIPASYTEIYSHYNSGTIGVMPLSGLFADSDKEHYQQIPIHQISMEFYKAKNVSTVQLAAAAVFADYVSVNSKDYGRAGWYPLRKSVVENPTFANISTSAAKIMKLVGSPEHFRTLDGHINEKNIYNTTFAESILMDMYELQDKTTIPYYVNDYKASISGMIAY